MITITPKKVIILSPYYFKIVEELETKRNNPRHKPTKPSYIHISIERLREDRELSSARNESKEFESKHQTISKSKIIKHAIKSSFTQNDNKLNKIKEIEIPSTADSDESFKSNEVTKIVINLSQKLAKGCPATLIEKYILEKEKQIIGYQLTSGCYGFLFKDNSKIIISRDLYQFYSLEKIIKEGKLSFEATLFNFSKIPSRLINKINDVNGLIELMRDQKFEPHSKRPNDFDTNFYKSKNVIYLRSYKKDNIVNCKIYYSL